MTRPALSAARSVDVLNFMASRPRESFTLSELSRQLGISTASGHAVLQALTAANYLVRDSRRKRYRLGPTLIALGHAALESHPAIDRARDEVRHLADSLQLECLALVVCDDEVMVLARAGRPRKFEVLPRVAQRLPLVPSMGTALGAWADEPTKKEWLDRLGPISEDQTAHITHAIEGIRSRGYDVGLETPTRKQIGDLLARHAHDAVPQEQWKPMLDDLFKTLAQEENQIVGPIDPHREYLVNYIMAPVTDDHGQVQVCLMVLGFEAPLSGQEIQKIGEVVVRACALAGVAGREASTYP
jgi:DNA-binding IclR family transcriptional regulator